MFLICASVGIPSVQINAKHEKIFSELVMSGKRNLFYLVIHLYLEDSDNNNKTKNFLLI